MEEVNISVCMATFNGEKFIDAQIRSIVEQLGPQDELIISDDNSTDSTLHIIAQFDDDRIKVFPDANCQKASANFGRAIGLARGKILVLSDQDDIWLPGKLSRIRELLIEKSTSCVMLDGQMLNNNLILSHSIQQHLNCGPGIWKNINKNTWMGCCMAFTSDLLPWILPIPRYVPMHDSWIGILAELKGSVAFDSTQSILYQVHGNNTSLIERSLQQKLFWRIQLIVALLMRNLRGKRSVP